MDAVADAVDKVTTLPRKDPLITVLLPEIITAGAPYVPITTLSSENTSRIGNPEISFTDISEPDRVSITENN